jgi:hypothetical protein
VALVLSSKRFENDPVLTECLNGQHRMMRPESGPAVRKVQQALIDSAYPLPVFGPDSIFGQETEQAVSDYKSDRGIHPSDGVVGPGTMAALDAEFADEPQPLPPQALGVGEMFAEEYIDAVRDGETANPGDTPEQMLTRIRQLYYPGTDPVGLTIRETTFDQAMLNAPIRESDGVTRRILRPGGMSQIMFSRITGSAYENAEPPDPPDNPGPYIVDPDGHRIDIGHALLTLDALLHTQTGAPYTNYGVPGIDPASWVADVAIAVVWTERDGSTAPMQLAPLPSGEPNFAGYYEMSAPEPDLLGDLDGFGLLEQWRATGGLLSDALTAYYLGGVGIDAGFHQRFRVFLTNVLGDPVVTRPQWLARINRFADLFDAGLGSIAVSNPPFGSWPQTPRALDRFLAWQDTGRAIEEGAHP